MTTHIARLLLLAALAGASSPSHPEFKPKELTLHDDDPAFCDGCKWKNMEFTCDFRVKYMMQHWKMTEEESKQYLLGEGDCHPMAEQGAAEESVGGGSAAAPTTVVEGADTTSEIEGEPGVAETAATGNDSNMQSADRGGAAAAAASESEIEATKTAAPNNDSNVQLASRGVGVVAAAGEGPSAPRHGVAGTVVMVTALLLLAAVTVVEHRRRKGLERKLADFQHQVEEQFRGYRDGGGEGMGFANDVELPDKVC